MADRPDHRWHDGHREQRQRPVQTQHDDENADQRQPGRDDVGKAPVVDGLDALGIVGDPERGIARAAGVVEFERQALQVGVKVSAQFQESLQSNPYEQEIAPQPQQARRQRDGHQKRAQSEGLGLGMAVSGTVGHPPHHAGSPGRENLVHDDAERPRLEQIQPDRYQRDGQREQRGPQKRLVVSQNAPVDGHHGAGGSVSTKEVAGKRILRYPSRSLPSPTPTARQSSN